MTEEIWKPVLGYEDRYEISNFGRFKIHDRFVNNRGKIKLRKGKIIDGHITGAGYRSFSIYINGSHKVVSMHRLVAEHFIDNPLNLPQVNHIDGNKLNNRLDNLEWCSSKHNVNHAIRIGLSNPPKGEKNGKSILKESDVLFILKNKEVFSIRDMGKMLGVSHSAVQLITSGKNWRHLKNTKH